MEQLDQRWRGRTSTFVSTKHRFDPVGYDVMPMPSDAACRDFVLEHHYSQSYPAARFRFGLCGKNGLEGVAVFSHPVRNDVLTNALPGLAKPTDGVELGRFVLLDSVGFNAETWFLARALDGVRRSGIRGVVSFSDPVPRQASCGRVTFAGHWGSIYRCASAFYRDRGTARTLRLLPDGRVFSDRALSKLRRGVDACRDCPGCRLCSGKEYAARTLLQAGADEADLRTPEGLRRILARLTRPLRHPGNLRYVFPLDRRMRRDLGEKQPYPQRPEDVG